jgi:RpiR family transcriptional regulator, carbohydrate utilization regulator
VFSAAVTTLPSMLRTVDSDELERLVDLLVEARVVFAVSTGGWAAEGASELAFGLTMIGRLAFFSADQLVQHLAAANLGPGDLCVVVSQSGSTRPNIEAAEVARSAGATVAAFGTHVRSHLEELVDLSVCLDRVGYFMDPDAAINHVGLILGVRSLVLAVRSKLGPSADAALQANLNTHTAYHYQADRRPPVVAARASRLPRDRRAKRMSG